MERWRKWRRRKPHALAGVAAAFFAVGVTTVFLWAYGSDRVGTARAALAQAAASVASEDFSTAVDQLEVGWQAVRWMPGQSDLKQDLQAQLTTARQGRLSQAVHELAEQLRFLDSQQSVPIAQLRKLDAGCQMLWDARDKIMPVGDRSAADPERASLRADLTDLAISWCALRERLGNGDQQAALRSETLQRLAEAESLCGASFALELAKHQYATLQVEHKGPANDGLPVARSAREHYALGRFLFKNDELSQSVGEFERAIALEPGTFWSYFYLSIAAYRLEEFERALDAANVCVALAPGSAPCYYNRAQCHQALGDEERALADLNRSLELDPSLAVAWLQRGALRAKRQEVSAARADLARALELGASPAETRYQLARVELAVGDREAARRHLSAAQEADADFAPAAALLVELDAAR